MAKQFLGIYAIFGIILLLAVLPFASANSMGITNIGSFKQGSCVSLIQTCANCTFVNISSIQYPNSSLGLRDKVMTKSGTFYNYSWCNASALGTYIVTGVGDLDALDEVWNYNFDITQAGVNYSTAEVIGFAAIMFLFFALVFVWKPNQIVLKSMFMILALLMALLLSTTISVSGLFSQANTVLIAVLVIIILFLSITILINIFRSLRAIKTSKKEKNENEIV